MGTNTAISAKETDPTQTIIFSSKVKEPFMAKKTETSGFSFGNL